MLAPSANIVSQPEARSQARDLASTANPVRPAFWALAGPGLLGGACWTGLAGRGSLDGARWTGLAGRGPVEQASYDGDVACINMPLACCG